MSAFQVYSPAEGKLLPLEQVPDPAFAEHMLGDGIAVEPSQGFTAAPFDGTVTSIHKALHAVVVSRPGLEVLIHVGVETVNLQGKGFKTLVKAGDKVKKGQHLTEFDPVFLAKNAPCNWVILIVTSPDGARLDKAPLGAVTAGVSPVFTLPDLQDEPQQAPAQTQQDWLYSRQIIIPNVNGLHARPAGKLAQAAQKYTFPIEIENEGRSANAKSLVAVMGMSLSYGSKVCLRAPQQDAQAVTALEELASLLESGLGESISEAAVCSAQEPCLCNDEQSINMHEPTVLKALTACAGIARGRAYLFTAADVEFEENAANADEQRQRLQKAVKETEADFTAEILSAPGKAAKEILQAHMELLKDPFLNTRSEEQINQGKSAPFAFNEAVRASIDVLKKTKNRFLLERIADFKDLRRRVLIKLTGKEAKRPNLPDGCIIIADELLPSDLALFDSRVHGVLLAHGSPTSHASILLRNMGLPSLVGAGECVLSVDNGTELGLNAADGLIYVRPTDQQKAELDQLLAQEKASREQNQKAAQEPALTRDGVRIYVCGNASNEREALSAAQNGADGLGLVRTEFLFFQGNEPPTEERQFMLYQNIAAALQGKPVTLRTLDVGGDKPVPYMPLPAEENPIVGLRGVRNYQAYRDIFLSQVRAMLRVHPAGTVRIMLPMVAFTDELKEYKKLILQEKEKLGISAPIELGIMIEVPSAALMARQFAQEADFFSLGTNDLTQYTLAIDRGHKTLCSRADHLNPAVLALIDCTCRGAQTRQRPVAVCGAMAGDLQAVPLLVGLGVTELAVGAAAIAQIKALVRTLDKKRCAEVAQKACTLNNAQEVRELVKKEFGV